MANALYSKGREGFLDGSIDWDTDDIRVILVDVANYVVDLATHKFLSSILAAARVAISGAFTGKTVTGGVADADDKTINAVIGNTFEALVIYKHTGGDATARLIAYMDTGTGLPGTPDGGDVVIQWDDGVNRIFKL